MADEAPKSQGIPAKLTLNLLAPHAAIFSKKEVDQVRDLQRAGSMSAQYGAALESNRI